VCSIIFSSLVRFFVFAWQHDGVVGSIVKSFDARGDYSILLIHQPFIFYDNDKPLNLPLIAFGRNSILLVGYYTIRAAHIIVNRIVRLFGKHARHRIKLLVVQE
jgi:hypothetical protein